MYEQFGATVNRDTGEVTFNLFVPDSEMDPHQYEGGGPARIRRVAVVGSFQKPQTQEWDRDNPRMMQANGYERPGTKQAIGTLYTYTTEPLPEGFYEYKYQVWFKGGCREVGDPCCRWGGATNQNSAFVVGSPYLDEVRPLPIARRLYQDLVIYELMIDDFTSQLPKRQRREQSPLEAVVGKLQYLKDLGFNAIEFMPWLAWIYPEGKDASDFGWGYNPVQYFSVAHKYTEDSAHPEGPKSRLYQLRQLISACHDLEMQVIMDGVFNHADASKAYDRDNGRELFLGFPYYWLYEDPADCPYVGNFAQADFFKDLDYANRCTMEYIRDACNYWIDEFRVDGIRFDNTAGMYKPDDRGHGIPKLLSELRDHLERKGNSNFALILEHEWNYGSIDVTNKVGATSCWLDPFRSQSMEYLGDRPAGHAQVEPGILRMLNAGKDFGEGRAPTIYIENHDHKRFMLKAGGRKFWHLTQPYAIGLFTSAGAVLMYNGQEFGVDNDMPEPGEKGDRVTPRPINWDLQQDDDGQQVQALYKKLIEIRQGHPGLRGNRFHPGHWEDWMRKPDPHGYGVDCDRNVVVYHRWEEAGGKVQARYYVVLNFSQEARQVEFCVADDGPWVDLLSGQGVTGVNNRVNVEVGSNWGAIYWKKYG